MELLNKTIIIDRLAMNALSQAITALVSVYTQVSPDIRKLHGTYDIALTGVFAGADDPKLMQAIQEKLATVD